MKLPNVAAKPASLVRKGAIPAALLAGLSSPLAYITLERWEGNVLSVYADNLAGGLPTYCAGRTDWKAKVGTRLTSDLCQEVNKITLLEYGYEVLGCTNWDHMTPRRVIALTIFAINVGKQGACNSQAVRAINAGRVIEGCNLIAYKPNGTPNWSLAGGKFVPGLFNRRKAERQICLPVQA
jgi:GH24 family phage-related lysozyme (muramidase)